MFTKILNNNQVEEFGKLTGIKATTVFISKDKKYYYASIVDNSIKVRISKELASMFV